MKIISLWQPYASLIFSGHKRFETRSFAYPSRLLFTQIGIHATMKIVIDSPEMDDLCAATFGADYRQILPRGAILGAVTLGMCYPTDGVAFDDAVERIVGDWTPGRFAWRLWQPIKLPVPVRAKGQQGWWNHE